MPPKMTPECEEGCLMYIRWVEDYTARLQRSKQETLDALYQTGRYTKKGTLRKRFQK